MSIADALAATSVADVDLSRYVAVPETATVAETVEAMREAGQSCACILSARGLAGVFTQRDVLHRVIGRPSTWDQPITNEMIRSVRTIRGDQSVADGLAIMVEWWVRSVPVLGQDDHLVGNLSWYVVMRAIADLVADRVMERSADQATIDHGLSLIDFTGLNTSPPVVVSADDSAETAAHHMKARGMGSVLVVDERDQLIGIVTEFDLLTKIGCDRADLAEIPGKELMTPDPVTVAARSSIAEAIKQMAERNFSHAPLMGESGGPVGMASFRDIAAYFEASLESLT